MTPLPARYVLTARHCRRCRNPVWRTVVSTPAGAVPLDDCFTCSPPMRDVLVSLVTHPEKEPVLARVDRRGWISAVDETAFVRVDVPQGGSLFR